MNGFLKNERGFTILELIIVIAIIGILAVLLIASLSEVRKKGRDARRDRDVHEIRTALNLYFAANGHYPTNGQPDPAMQIGTANDYLTDALEDGGHMTDVPTDPLQVAPDFLYQYRPSDGNRPNSWRLNWCTESPYDCRTLEP